MSSSRQQSDEAEYSKLVDYHTLMHDVTDLYNTVKTMRFHCDKCRTQLTAVLERIEDRYGIRREK